MVLSCGARCGTRVTGYGDDKSLHMVLWDGKISGRDWGELL